jgi:hypothetical protein
MFCFAVIAKYPADSMNSGRKEFYTIGRYYEWIVDRLVVRNWNFSLIFQGSKGDQYSTIQRNFWKLLLK